MLKDTETPGDSDERLTKAVNHLACYVDHNLPPGWRIELHLEHDDACFFLFDPDGRKHEAPTDGECELRELCDYAKRAV